MYVSIVKRSRYTDFDEKISYAKKLANVRKSYGDLSNEQNVHRMICDMAGGCKRKNQNLLYIKLGRDAKTFYIQSDSMLDKDMIHAFGYELVSVKNESIFLESIKDGDQVILRAKLAPVKRNKETRAIHSLANNVEKRVTWLEHLSERCGFRFIDHYGEGVMERIDWEKKNRGSSWTNAFYYTSQIEITDKKRFIQAIEVGVGKYKAYGCGMLMVG